MSKRQNRVNILVDTMRSPKVLATLGIKEIPTSGTIGISFDLTGAPDGTKGSFKGGFVKEFKSSDELVRTIAELTEVKRKGYGTIFFTLELNGKKSTLAIEDNNGFVEIDEKDALAVLAWASGNKDIIKQ